MASLQQSAVYNGPFHSLGSVGQQVSSKTLKGGLFVFVDVGPVVLLKPEDEESERTFVRGHQCTSTAALAPPSQPHALLQHTTAQVRIDQAQHQGRPLMAMAPNLDGFKAVNDTLGRVARGKDTLLKTGDEGFAGLIAGAKGWA